MSTAASLRPRDRALPTQPLATTTITKPQPPYTSSRVASCGLRSRHDAAARLQAACALIEGSRRLGGRATDGGGHASTSTWQHAACVQRQNQRIRSFLTMTFAAGALLQRAPYDATLAGATRRLRPTSFKANLRRKTQMAQVARVAVGQEPRWLAETCAHGALPKLERQRLAAQEEGDAGDPQHVKRHHCVSNRR